MSKLAFGLPTVDIVYLPLRQDLLSKNVLMTAQMDSPLGNRPSIFDPMNNAIDNGDNKEGQKGGKQQTRCHGNGHG